MATYDEQGRKIVSRKMGSPINFQQNIDKWRMEALQILQVQIDIWQKEARKLNLWYGWDANDAIAFLNQQDIQLWLPNQTPTAQQVKKLVTEFEDWTLTNAEKSHWSQDFMTAGHNTDNHIWWRMAERVSGKQAAKSQPQPNWGHLFPGYFEEMTEAMQESGKIEGENYNGFKFVRKENE